MLMKTILISLMLSLSFICAVFCQEQENTETKLFSTIKEVVGEVSVVSRDYIAIVYGRDEKKGLEEEVLLPLIKNVRIEHKQSLSQIKAGDTVKVEFEEITEQGKESTKRRRIARKIVFVRAAENKPEAFKLPEPGEGLPDDITVKK